MKTTRKAIKTFKKILITSLNPQTLTAWYRDNRMVLGLEFFITSLSPPKTIHPNTIYSNLHNTKYIIKECD